MTIKRTAEKLAAQPLATFETGSGFKMELLSEEVHYLRAKVKGVLDDGRAFAGTYVLRPGEDEAFEGWDWEPEPGCDVPGEDLQPVLDALSEHYELD